MPALRGNSRLSGSTLTFVLDKPDRPVRHVFTPENVVRGSLSATYNTFTEQTPDDVTVTYLDEAAGFQQRDVTATLPNSDSRSTATRSFIGVVKREQAFFMAVRMAASNRHRRLVYKWRTEAAGRLLAMGDVVSLNHPFLATVQSGELRDWDASALSFDLGKEIQLPVNESVYLALNGRDGKPWGPCKINRVEGTTVFLDQDDYALLLEQGADSPFEWASNGQEAFATVWTLQSAPEFEGRAIITSVAPVDRFHYEITAMNDAPEAYGYQDLPVPPWGYRQNTPGDVDLTAPTGFVVRAQGTEQAPVINLSWLPVPGASGYLAEYSSNNGSWTALPSVSINDLTVAVEPGLIAIRVAAVNSQKQSPWGRWSGDTSILFLPPVEMTLLGNYVGGELKVGWTPPAGSPAYDYQISIHPDNSDVAVRTADLGASARDYSYTAAMGVADGGPWRGLTVALESQSYLGASRTSTLEVEDPPPAEPTNMEYQLTSTSVTLTAAEVAGEHTGFLVVRGDADNFGIEEVVEMRTYRTLPAIWDGLQPGTVYHFRLAAVDGFFDVAADHLSLNYSGVLTVTTPTG